MAIQEDRCSQALAGVSSVLHDITQELQNAQSQVKYWQIEADAWRCRYEQERARSDRLRRMLRCTPGRANSLTAQPSLAVVSPRAGSAAAAAAAAAGGLFTTSSTSVCFQALAQQASALQRSSSSSCRPTSSSACGAGAGSSSGYQNQQQQEYSSPGNVAATSAGGASHAAGLSPRSLKPLKCLVEDADEFLNPCSSALEGPARSQGFGSSPREAFGSCSAAAAEGEAASGPLPSPSGEQLGEGLGDAAGSLNPEQQQGISSSSSSSKGRQGRSRQGWSHDGSYDLAAGDDEGAGHQHPSKAAAAAAATCPAAAAAAADQAGSSHPAAAAGSGGGHMPDPFASCSFNVAADGVQSDEEQGGLWPDRGPQQQQQQQQQGMQEDISIRGGTVGAAAAAQDDQQQRQQKRSDSAVLDDNVDVLNSEGGLSSGCSSSQQQQHQQPPPFRRSRTLPRSFGGGSGSSSSSSSAYAFLGRSSGSILPAGWPGQLPGQTSFGGQTFGQAGQTSGQTSSKHTVDQLLRMMMAFTIMQGGGQGAGGEADGAPGFEGTEDEPLPTVSLDDDDGSSGVGLAAAAAVSAAMARAWAAAASKEQRSVAAAAAAAGSSGSGPGEGGAGGGGVQRAGFRLVATVTNKMGKRAQSSAALASAYSQDSLDGGSSSSNPDLAGMVRNGSGNNSGSSSSLARSFNRKGSGGLEPAAAAAGEAEQAAAAAAGGSSSSSGAGPLAAAAGGGGSSSSPAAAAGASRPPMAPPQPSAAATGSTAATAAAATAATRGAVGAAPNTGQATAISLHWLSRPHTVLVMRKLAPSTEAAFMKALEWLRCHRITIYVEPKVFQGLLDSGRMMPCGSSSSSSSSSGCLTGMLVHTGSAAAAAAGGAGVTTGVTTGAAAAGTAGGTSAAGDTSKGAAAGPPLPTACSWPAPMQQSRYTSSSGPAAAAAAAGQAPASGVGLIKTWQPEVTIDQSGQQQQQQQQKQDAAAAGSSSSGSVVSVSDLIPDAVAQQLDLVVVLGGDGTVLWTCHIFGNRSVPPLVPFNLGSLGFLTPFDPARLEQVLLRTLRGGFPITLRHRLHCTIVRCANTPGGSCSQQLAVPGSSAVTATSVTAAALDMPAVSRSCVGSCVYGEEHVALNEVVIERGISPFLTNLECFCDGAFVTHVQGDGLIIGTPTGSTAYSLAAGGSMVHPQVPCILFTPICPHSLSFRPLMFPDYCQLCIQVPVDSRGHVWASFDGKDRTELGPGDAVVVRLSRWPVPSVAAEADPSGDWFCAVRECLHWNMRKVQGGAGM